MYNSWCWDAVWSICLWSCKRSDAATKYDHNEQDSGSENDIEYENSEQVHVTRERGKTKVNWMSIIL